MNVGFHRDLSLPSRRFAVGAPERRGRDPGSARDKVIGGSPFPRLPSPMYSTCIHCNRPLGANEAVELFPVGRRLAFDAEKGRLWVVCPHCARWNLSPLETRWEAIEACERLYHDARLRASTENVGVARMPDGTDLVRVGRPQRPEFAAWRYGDQLGLRRRRALVRWGTGLGAGGAAMAAGAVALGGVAMAVVPVIGLYGMAGAVQAYNSWQDHLRMTKVPDGEGNVFTFSGFHLKETTLAPGAGANGWSLHLQHVRGRSVLHGAAARRVLAAALVRVNETGAGARKVRRAAEMIGGAGGPERLLRSLAFDSQERMSDYMERRAAHRRGDYNAAMQNPFLHRVHPVNQGALPRLPGEVRLALEMAAHEDAERRALEGELAILEAAWRDAEAIAAVADRLAIPADVERRLGAGRGTGSDA
jgi:hypothetical protein